MTNLFGFNVDGAIGAMGDQFSRGIAAMGDRFNQFTGGNPFGVAGPEAGNAFGMASPAGGNAFSAAAPTAGNAFQAAGPQSGSPFAAAGIQGGNAFIAAGPQGGSAFGASGPSGGNPFSPTPPVPINTSKVMVSTPASTSTGGLNFAGPATADENKGLTGAQIDSYISTTHPGSPLAGMGQFILDEANKRGVSVPLLIGIMTLESGLGTEQGTLPGVYNYGGLTGSGWAGQTGNTTGMARAFAMFGSKEDGLRALMDNLASSTYKGKSVQQQIGTWYLGNPDAGLDQTDEVGNASMRQYLATVAAAYQGLGVASNPTAAPTRVAGAQGGVVAAGAKYLGAPYVLGGLRTHPDNPMAGIDCSEFTARAYKDATGKDLPWNAQAQYDSTQRVDQANLQPGDLVFFQGTYDTGRGETITHVGIFVGNGMMINASSDGVSYQNLNDPYWKAHFAGYGRVP